MNGDPSETMGEVQAKVEGGVTDRFLERLVDQIGGRAGVQAVFGAPIERDGVTVVPVARIRWGFGAGSGSGSGPAEAAGAGTASGSGGGGGASGDPVGYVEIGPSGASFRPIVAPYPNPLFLIAVGIMVGSILRGLARLLGR